MQPLLERVLPGQRGLSSQVGAGRALSRRMHSPEEEPIADLFEGHMGLSTVPALDAIRE